MEENKNKEFSTITANRGIAEILETTPAYSVVPHENISSIDEAKSFISDRIPESKEKPIFDDKAYHDGFFKNTSLKDYTKKLDKISYIFGRISGFFSNRSDVRKAVINAVKDYDKRPSKLKMFFLSIISKKYFAMYSISLGSRNKSFFITLSAILLPLFGLDILMRFFFETGMFFKLSSYLLHLPAIGDFIKHYVLHDFLSHLKETSSSVIGGKRITMIDVKALKLSVIMSKIFLFFCELALMFSAAFTFNVIRMSTFINACKK